MSKEEITRSEFISRSLYAICLVTLLIILPIVTIIINIGDDETTDSTPQSEMHHAAVDRYEVRGSGAEIILDNGQTMLMSKHSSIRPLMTPGAYIAYQVDDDGDIIQNTIEIKDNGR